MEKRKLGELLTMFLVEGYLEENDILPVLKKGTAKMMGEKEEKIFTQPLQKESEWEKEFDKKYNHDDPNGKALVLIQSNEVGHSQYPAQEMIKYFIRNAISTAVSNREKEIAEEVEKFMPADREVNYHSSYSEGKIDMAEKVLQIIKH